MDAKKWLECTGERRCFACGEKLGGKYRLFDRRDGRHHSHRPISQVATEIALNGSLRTARALR